MSSTPPDGPHGFELSRVRRAIVVLDVVESVRLMQEHEDDVIDRWRRFVHEVRSEVLGSSGGRMVKSLGDGMLLEFEDVRAAVATAAQLHRRIQRYNLGRDEAASLYLRIGVHVADVVVDEFDVFGTGVNLAARLASLAGPGETVASGAARDELVAQVDGELEDLGDCHLKHLERTVRAFRVGPAGREAAALPPAPDIGTMRPTLAVLPFTVLGGVPFVGDAVADDLIARLSGSDAVRVISRMSTAQLGGRGLPQERIAAMLKAAYLVHGSCVVEGDRLRVRAELSRAASGEVVWAQSVQGSVRGSLFGDGTLTEALAQGLAGAMFDAELQLAAQRPLANLEAYTLLLSAIQLMHRCTPADFARAADLLEHLAERHPRAAAAHAYLAKWHVMRTAQGWSADPQADGRRARERARRALDADERHPLALSIDGLVAAHVDRDMALAGQRYGQAMKVSPSEPLARLFVAALHAYNGDGDQAEAGAAQALALSPLDPLKFYFNTYAGTALLAADRYERVIGLSEEALRLNRGHTPTYRNLAIAQWLLGHADDARRTVSQMLQLDPGFTVAKFRARYPGMHTPRGAQFADALGAAGVPEGSA